MSDLKTSVVVDLAGNLPRQAPRFAQSINQFSNTSSRSLGRVQRGIGAVSRGISKLGNRYTSLLTGAGAVGVGSMLISHQERMTRLGIQANISADQVDKLNQQIYQVAQQPEIRVDPTQLLGAVEQIVEKTGDLKFAQDNLENIGLAISATGAMGTDIGGITAEFQKMGLVGKGDVRAALDILIAQGKEGAFTLQNLASLGPRVVTAYTSMGRTGLPAIREMGAALQMVRQGTGSSEMAATAFEALMRTLGDARKVEMLQKGGLQIFDPDQPGVIRPINELMGEIITKTKGSKLVLSKVFDAEAMRAFNASIAEFTKNGEISGLEKFYQVQADGSQILEDSKRAADTAAGSLRMLSAAGRNFADDKLAEPIKDLAHWVNELDPDEIREYFDTAVTGAKVLAGVVLSIKAAELFSRGRNAFSRGARKGGLGGMAGAAGATPVYVVNMPGGGMQGGMQGVGVGVDGGNDKKRRSTSRRVRNRLRVGRYSMPWFGHRNIVSPGGGMVAPSRRPNLAQRMKPGLGSGVKVGGAISALMAAPTLYNIATDDQSSKGEKLDAATEVVGGAAGGWAGAAAGAAIGSVVPVVGTAIGGLIGGALGAWGGASVGDWLGDFFTSDDDKNSNEELADTFDKAIQQTQQPAEPVAAELTVKVDGDARVSHMSVNNPNWDMSVEHRLGPSMGLNG